MRNPYRARVDERHFLNLPGFHAGAYVHAYVEDSSERDLPERSYDGEPYNFQPRMILAVADCSERADLSFEIDSPLDRMNAFHKIDTLIDTLQQFRAGLVAECRLYRARQADLDARKEAAQAKPTTAQQRAAAARDRALGRCA